MSGTNAISTLVWNEHTKLLANSLDRASTAFGTGAVFPLVNMWRAFQANASTIEVGYFAASSYVFIFVAAELHLIARRALKVLR